MPTYIVLLGPPGVGKGTQARILSEETGLVHVSSGDLFRENLKNQTELGKLAKSFMDKGELVPDDVTINMIKDRISRPDCKAGAVLDGFPRTPAQADALEVMLKSFEGAVNAVPYITAAEHILVERASGRWTCRANGHIYHEKFNPPKQARVCDIDGSEVYQRDDDKVETVTKRIRVYLEQTMPLVEYYRKAGKLIEIDGTQAVEEVTKVLLSALKK
ncbi:MAG TPA: adenylate kinase [Anaerolineales bacterium]|nr:adenylate kinase [Anaerolineales bacterium]HND46970.1 adenylate kinase [Anaerolineales bacterium]HNE03259.1 adenylate kinase [Anaerolineales bacterium]HNH26937.1 adenylate kinase [Anaerolineales bacterium]HNO95635.1 adenylate kinase [Anaerolineales bacterium]